MGDDHLGVGVADGEFVDQERVAEADDAFAEEHTAGVEQDREV
ncbi:MAG TPA: hypothetical protein PLT07_09105 [Trueperaceae bacterium]|nr:hypothetical protein [Trueperaceae bacterium]